MSITALFLIKKDWNNPNGLQQMNRYRNCGLSISTLKINIQGFPGGAVVENLPANAGDTGSSPGLGRSHMPWSNWAREP